MYCSKVSLLPYDAGLEFPKERLRLGKQIGSGAFGRVFKAQALGILYLGFIMGSLRRIRYSRHIFNLLYIETIILHMILIKQ